MCLFLAVIIRVITLSALHTVYMHAMFTRHFTQQILTSKPPFCIRLK